MVRSSLKSWRFRAMLSLVPSLVIVAPRVASAAATSGSISGLTTHLQTSGQFVFSLVQDGFFAIGILSVAKGIHMLYSAKKRGDEPTGHAWWWIFGGGLMMGGMQIAADLAGLSGGNATVTMPSFTDGSP